jgi:arginase
MDLAIVSGRRPAVLTHIDRLKPLVRDHDVVAFGFRDAEQARQYGSQSIRVTAIHARELDEVRELGAAAAAEQAVGILQRNDVEGFWIHVDAAVGMNVGIFNPAMDADSSIARGLVSCLVAGLR